MLRCTQLVEAVTGKKEPRVGGVSVLELHIPRGSLYAAFALPPGGFLDLVEVGSRRSTTRVAYLYSGVPNFSRAGAGVLTISHAQSGIRPARDTRLHDEYRPDLNRAGPCRAENPRSGLVIGVAFRPWDPFQPAVQHAQGRPDRRPSSLSDLVETATSRRQSWGTTLRKTPAPPT